MAYKIVVIPGDGIGKEITDAAVKVLQAADKKFGLDLQYTYKDAGGTAYDRYGKPLPEETLAACREADAVLFGAVGGDKWDHVDPALRPEKAILGLRKGLGLYANLRPVRIEEALVDYSPLKPELARVRELILSGGDLRADPLTEKHADWAEELKTRYTFTPENSEEIIRTEVGLVFAKVLEHAGVYKRSAEGKAAFLRFVDYVNTRE